MGHESTVGGGRALAALRGNHRMGRPFAGMRRLADLPEPRAATARFE
ncbi:MAG: hypothetical protein R2720_00830 [Candidatus Nanopelagicales bacterium]